MKVKPLDGSGPIGIEGVASAGAKPAVSDVEAASGVSGSAELEAIVEAVRSGSLSGQAAVDRVMDLALGQARTAGLDPQAVTRLKERIEEVIAEDPVLQSLVTRLGG